jgi:tetratricopeptide (TPR) repeat protein
VLQLVAIAAVLGAQPAPVRSPYLDAIQAYGAGADADAAVVRAVSALRLNGPARIADALDLPLCRAVGARSCQAIDLARLEPERRAALFARWRSVYPRALAVHVELIGGLHPARDADALTAHRAIVLRLIARIDEIAAHHDVGDDFARFAVAGRRLLVWAHQYLRDEAGLAKTLEALAPALPQDAELQLARAALAELRAEPDAVAAGLRAGTAASGRAASLHGSANAGGAGERVPDRRRHATALLDETRHRLEVAAAAYRQAMGAGAGGAEPHLRVARILLRLDRPDQAEAHLSRALALTPDPRQTYLIALFIADLRERQLRTADAMAAYARALAAWPGAQAAAIGLARLRAMSGAADAARATLSRIHAERDMRERSDPWMGYVGGQGWRVPGALDALRRDFEPVP